MSERKRFFVLALIMVGACALVAAIIMTVLYRHDIQEQRDMLQVTAQSQARLIEAVARYDAKMAHLIRDERPDHDAFAATVSQIVDSHERYEGFGDTGEFMLAQREGDSIVFILRHRHGAVDRPEPVAFDAHLAEPMRRALQGLSGTVIDIDYRGETVVAAYEPVAELDLGIVAKIDLSEIRAPFIRVGITAAIAALVVILVGTIVFLRVSNPLIARLAYTRALENEIEERKRAEETLGESEERFRTLAEQAGDAFFLIDPDSAKFIDVNVSACEVLQYGREEMLALTVNDIGPEEQVGKFAESTANLCLGETATIEARHKRKDGTTFPVEIRSSLIEIGGKRRVLALARDITTRRRLEQDYQTLFRETLNGLALHEIICDPQGKPVDYRFLAVNPAFERMTGLKAQYVTGKTVVEVLPGTEAHWIETYGKVALTGEPVFFENYSQELDRHFQVTAFRPAPNQFACIFADVTERTKAEEALRESDKKHRELTENLPQRIFHKDINSIYVSCNKHYADDLGVGIDEIEGKSDFDFHPKELAEQYRVDDRRVMESGQTKEIEESYIKDGEERFIHTIKSPLADEAGKVTGVLGIFWDITDRKLAEKEHEKLENQLRQAQKMEAVGQLAGGVAHDFNNLLQVILGYGEIALRKGGRDDPSRAALEQMLKAGNRAKELVSQLLAFSRRQVLDMQDIDINVVIEGVMKMIRRVIGEHVTSEFLPGADLGIVRADPGQIEQILMNLCVNARDAMPHGGRIIIETENARIDEAFCETHSWATLGHYAVLSVTDTGCGMDDETLANIFEPFFTTKNVGEGTGLGLSTVYGLVKQHEGMIHVYSEIDKGTRIKVYLPLVEGSIAVEGEETEEPAQGGTETVLLAEDEEVVRDLCKTLLEYGGYTVIVAEDGAEAVRLFDEHADEIDMALLDVMMPKLGGGAVYEHVHQARPDIPVLFASGYSMSAIHTNFVLDQGLALIQKPYQCDELLRKVREVLDSE
jgi:two-component system, cell cycle sensor histidine kinase and response regulator CckA